mgnify:CR=1 FL=1
MIGISASIIFKINLLSIKYEDNNSSWSHQIGGSAIEISIKSTRIIMDFGNELSLDEKYIPENLDIEGVTVGVPNCDGIVISHYHMDHLGQLTSALPDIPLYMGELSKEIALIGSEYQDKDLYLRLLGANTFREAKPLLLEIYILDLLLSTIVLRIVICLSLKLKVNVS